jgi:hypothetical protein
VIARRVRSTNATRPVTLSVTFGPLLYLPFHTATSRGTAAKKSEANHSDHKDPQACHCTAGRKPSVVRQVLKGGNPHKNTPGDPVQVGSRYRRVHIIGVAGADGGQEPGQAAQENRGANGGPLGRVGVFHSSFEGTRR